jgi:hypothetical protein
MLDLLSSRRPTRLGLFEKAQSGVIIFFCLDEDGFMVDMLVHVWFLLIWAVRGVSWDRRLGLGYHDLLVFWLVFLYPSSLAILGIVGLRIVRVNNGASTKSLKIISRPFSNRCRFFSLKIRQSEKLPTLSFSPQQASALIIPSSSWVFLRIIP